MNSFFYQTLIEPNLANKLISRKDKVNLGLMLNELSAMLDPESVRFLLQEQALLSKKDEFILEKCVNIMLSGCVDFHDIMSSIGQSQQPLCFFSLLGNQSVESKFSDSVSANHPLTMFYRWCLSFDANYGFDAVSLMTDDKREFAAAWLTQLLQHCDLGVEKEKINQELVNYQKRIADKQTLQVISKRDHMINQFLSFVLRHSYLGSAKLIAEFFNIDSWTELCAFPDAFTVLIKKIVDYTSSHNAIAELSHVFSVLNENDTDIQNTRFWLHGSMNNKFPAKSGDIMPKLIFLRACAYAGEINKACDTILKNVKDLQMLPRGIYALELLLADRDCKIIASDTERLKMFLSAVQTVNFDCLDDISWKTIVLLCLQNECVAKWVIKYHEPEFKNKTFASVYQHLKTVQAERKPAVFLQNLFIIPRNLLREVLDMYLYNRQNHDFVNDILQNCCYELSNNIEPDRMKIIEILAETYAEHVTWTSIPFHVIELIYLIKSQEGGTKQNLRIVLVKLLNSPTHDQLPLIEKAIEVSDMLGAYEHAATMSNIASKHANALKYLRKCENWKNCTAAMLSLWSEEMLELFPSDLPPKDNECESEKKIKQYYLEYLLQISEEI